MMTTETGGGSRTGQGRWMKPQYIPGLVSVIIPTYERANLVIKAMDSVWDQTYRPIELLLVDDGSTDTTKERVEAWRKKHPDDATFTLSYSYQQNRGASAARNLGLVQSRGEFVQFLDSDDLLHTLKLETQVKQLGLFPQAGLSYCITTRFSAPAPEICFASKPSARTGVAFRTILPHCLRQRLWHTLSPLWRRCACLRIGPWRDFARWEDWEYDCRAGIAGVLPVHCAALLAHVRDHQSDRSPGEAPDDLRDARSLAMTALSILGELERAGMVQQAFVKPIAKRLFAAGRRFLSENRAPEGEHYIRTAIAIAPAALKVELRLFLRLAGFFGAKPFTDVAERCRSAWSG